MRHVPGVDELLARLEAKFKPRLLLLASIAESHREGEGVARKLAATCHWLAHVSEVCRHREHVHRDEQGSLAQRIERSITVAADALRHIDPDLFRRREPFHHFERSEGERVFTAVAAIGSLIEEAAALAVKLDPGLFERFYEHERSPAIPRLVERTLPAVESVDTPVIA